MRLCVAVARERLPRYSIDDMEEGFSAYQAFNTSAATAVTIIANFCNLQGVPVPPRIDVQRIAYLEKLADELEKGLSDAKRILEEVPTLAALTELEAGLSSLREKYGACWQQWRKEGGQELTPPRLWRRLGEADKILKRLYQDVCNFLEDHLDAEDFRAAKKEWEREGKKTIPWEKIKADMGL